MHLSPLILGFALILGSAVPCTVAAQFPVDSVSLPVGSVVRLRAPVLGRAREIGSVHAWRADTLVLAPVTTLGRIAVPVGSLTSIERAIGSGRGRRASTAAGAALGGLLGGAAGTFVSLAERAGAQSDTPAEPLRALPIVSGAVIGALLGGATGWRIGPRRWVRIPLR